MVTTLGLLPRAGAQNSGMWTVFPERSTPYTGACARLRVQCGNPKATADGKGLVPRSFNEKDILQLGQLLRHFCGEVVRLAPVFLEVVELPNALSAFTREYLGAHREPRGCAVQKRRRSSHRGRWRGCP